MRVIDPVLHIGDIKTIFGVSQPTVYRWLADARAGKSLFPLFTVERLFENWHAITL